MKKSKAEPKTKRKSLLGRDTLIDIATEFENLNKLPNPPTGTRGTWKIIGTEKPPASTDSENPFEKWILAFKKSAAEIERGMWSEMSAPQRERLQRSASDELNILAVDFDEPTMAGDLDEIFELLEAKLLEMADVLNDPGLRSKFGITLPDSLKKEDESESGAARRQVNRTNFPLYKSDRKFLFTGYMLDLTVTSSPYFFTQPSAPPHRGGHDGDMWP